MAVFPPLPTDFEAWCQQRLGLESVPPEGPLLEPFQLVDFAQELKAQGYLQFLYCAASHHPASASEPEHLLVAWRVRRLFPATDTVPFRVKIPVDGSVPSLCEVWIGADWQEREQFDLVGVRFDNHPDLRRIMMPEDWEGHPLRKNYAIDTHHFPWR